MGIRFFTYSAVFTHVVAAFAISQTADRLLMRDPTISRTQIVFEYADDLWIISREGGEAKRLTADMGEEFHPRFSPDGSLIAFAGMHDGNTDVYVVSAAGGIARHLTYHPAFDVPIGWTPDGKQILLSSTRASPPEPSSFSPFLLTASCPLVLHCP
jgi:tricorn protease